MTDTREPGSDDAPTPENPRIVEAVGTAVSAARGGSGLALAQRLEAAMVAETEACAAEGIIDPDVIRDRKLAAYQAEKEAAEAEAEEARQAEAERLAALGNEPAPEPEADAEA